MSNEKMPANKKKYLKRLFVILILCLASLSIIIIIVKHNQNMKYEINLDGIDWDVPRVEINGKTYSQSFRAIYGSSTLPKDFSNKVSIERWNIFFSNSNDNWCYIECDNQERYTRFILEELRSDFLFYDGSLYISTDGHSGANKEFYENHIANVNKTEKLTDQFECIGNTVMDKEDCFPSKELGVNSDYCAGKKVYIYNNDICSIYVEPAELHYPGQEDLVQTYVLYQQ